MNDTSTNARELRCDGVRPSTLRRTAVVAVALAIGACGKPQSGPPVPSGDVAEQTYGVGVQPNAAVTYQPDVVLVGGGAKSIRSASADGLVWIIDGHAEHAQDLVPGKIMIATSRAAGRVMNVEHQGDDLAVTLGPMQLADVLLDADFAIKQPFHVADMVIQAVPELPRMYRDYNALDAPPPPVQIGFSQPYEKEPADYLIRLMPIQLASAETNPANALPSAGKSAGKVSVGDWEIELTSRTDNPLNMSGAGKSTERISIKIQRKVAGLKAGIELGVYVQDLQFETHTVYRDGKIDAEASSIVLEGLKGVDVDISTGIAKAIGDNKKIRIEIPLEFAKPCPVYGVPLMCQLKIKFLIETALGGNNATLSANSQFAMQGALGVRQGKIVTPKVTESGSTAESVKGVSLGVSGVVFTFETRFMTGLGVPAFFTGPYSKFTVATGVTHGAGLGAGFTSQCSAITSKIDGGVGWGFQIPADQLGVLKTLLKGGKIESEAYEVTETFFRRDTFSPNLKICQI